MMPDDRPAWQQGQGLTQAVKDIMALVIYGMKIYQFGEGEWVSIPPCQILFVPLNFSTFSTPAVSWKL